MKDFFRNLFSGWFRPKAGAPVPDAPQPQPQPPAPQPTAETPRVVPIRRGSPLQQRRRQLEAQLAGVRRREGLDSTRQFPLLLQLVHVCEVERDLPGAEGHQRALVALAEHHDAAPQIQARALVRLAQLCSVQGRKEEAQELQIQAVRVLRQPGRDELAQAVALQQQGRWWDAMRVCDQALEQEGDDPILELNALICRYHLGAGAAVADRVVRLVGLLPMPQAIHGVMLALLCLRERGELGRARHVAQLLNALELGAWDLPAVPAAVTEAFAIETGGVRPIREALLALQSEGSCRSDETKVLQHLAARYAQRERGLAAA